MQTLSVDKLKQHYAAILREVAKEKGLNGDGVNVLEKIMHVESGGNMFSRNGKSTAAGLFQPIDDTWNRYVRKYPNEIKPDGRYDPIQQVKFAVYFTLDNQKSLKKSLNRDATGGELYLAHFLGDNGAISIIKESNNRPNTPLKGFLPQSVIDSNSEVFFKMDGNRGLEFKEFTVGDLANWANAKMGEKPKYATNSEPHYRRNKLGIPEVLGNMTMVAIGAVFLGAAYLISEVIGLFSDDESKSPPPTPRRTTPRSRA